MFMSNKINGKKGLMPKIDNMAKNKRPPNPLKGETHTITQKGEK